MSYTFTRLHSSCHVRSRWNKAKNLVNPTMQHGDDPVIWTAWAEPYVGRRSRLALRPGSQDGRVEVAAAAVDEGDRHHTREAPSMRTTPKYCSPDAGEPNESQPADA